MNKLVLTAAAAIALLATGANAQGQFEVNNAVLTHQNLSDPNAGQTTQTQMQTTIETTTVTVQPRRRR